MSYLNLIMLPRCHFCFKYPSIWLFLPLQTWNKWEPESEISVVSIHESSANALQVLSVCSFRQGYLICWFMGRVWDCSTQARCSRFPAVSGVSPAVDSGGSFQLWLLWLLELPCSTRGRRRSASLTWDLKASPSLWLLRRRGWEFWASLFSFS